MLIYIFVLDVTDVYRCHCTHDVTDVYGGNYMHTSLLTSLHMNIRVRFFFMFKNEAAVYNREFVFWGQVYRTQALAKRLTPSNHTFCKIEVL